MAADVITKYDHVKWSDFLGKFIWRQGEHLIAVAPTKGGKTTLLSQVLPRRDYVVVFVTKAHDPSFTKHYRGYKRVESWAEVGPLDHRVLLWPKPEKTIREFAAKQRRVFSEALNRIFIERGWTVVIDEQHYCCTTLGLAPEIAMFLHQGRSSGLTVVNGIQRPAHVPVVSYSGSQHAFIWKTTDKKDAARLAALGGTDDKELAHNALTLADHEFIYVNTVTGNPLRSKVEI